MSLLLCLWRGQGRTWAQPLLLSSASGYQWSPVSPRLPCTAPLPPGFTAQVPLALGNLRPAPLTVCSWGCESHSPARMFVEMTYGHFSAVHLLGSQRSHPPITPGQEPRQSLQWSSSQPHPLWASPFQVYPRLCKLPQDGPRQLSPWPYNLFFSLQQLRTPPSKVSPAHRTLAQWFSKQGGGDGAVPGTAGSL